MPQPLPFRPKVHWQDGVIYFLTTATFLHYPYFQLPEQKQIVLNKIMEIKKVLNVPILAFSIALNHFHLKFYLENGKLMTQVKIMLHSGISREYHQKYQVPYPEFWQSTKTLYIKDEETSWKVTGYIAGNLLKHKEVSTFEELKQNPFSSFRYLTEKVGDEVAKNLVRSVIQTNEDSEGEINLSVLKKTKLPRAAKPPSRTA